MARVFSRDELPTFASLRDGRARLDLVTENVPVEARELRADRIVYGPGDTSAVHYHVGCVHVFYVLRGEGVAHVEEESLALSAGDVLTIEAGEVHWFENPGAGEFAFVEFWAPPPVDTVWTQQGDACTWRPLTAAEARA